MINRIIYLKGRIHEKKQSWEKAENEYQKISAEKRRAIDHYRLAFTLIKLKQWEKAEDSLLTAITLRPERVQWRIKLAFVHEKQNRWGDALKQYDLAIANNPSSADWYYRKAKSLMALKQWPKAEAFFHKALEFDDLRPEWQYRLSESLKKQGKMHLEANALEKATHLDPKQDKWFYRLGCIYDEMQQIPKALIAYKKAISLNPKNAEYHFRLGSLFKGSNQLAESNASYHLAISHDSKFKSCDFGIGVFHQKNGHWISAIEEYESKCTTDALNAELKYRLAQSYDRCYQWVKAADAHRQSIALDSSAPYRHARLAFTLERSGKWKEAANAYNMALTISKSLNIDWVYRQGYSLYQAKLFKESCEVFVMMEKQPSTYSFFKHSIDKHLPLLEENNLEKHRSALSLYIKQSDSLEYSMLIAELEKNYSNEILHFKIGNHYEKHSDWPNAAKYYRSAIERKDDFNSAWFYRLGYALFKCDEFEQASKAFKQTQILQKASGFSEKDWPKSTYEKRLRTYTEYYETIEIKNESILYESYLGSKMSCNPYAIFKSLLNDSRFEGWKHIWVINDNNAIPKEFISLDNVIFIKKHSDLYLRYLNSSKYLVNNVTFPEYFICKPEQKYLNTWHGTPIKNLGKDLKEGLLEHQNVTRNFLHATHIISQNQHTTNILMNQYDVNGIYNGIIAETGYPRMDLMLNISDEKKSALKETLNIEASETVVLYAPTWRGDHGKARFDTKKLVEDLEEIQKTGCCILFRGHHFVEKLLNDIDITALTVPEHIDTNELLGIVDILITDYSSIAVDFMAFAKPILFYTYDIEEYQSQRGLYFDYDEMPGVKCHSISRLCASLQDFANDFKYYSMDNALKEKFVPHDNGQSTEKVIDMFFFDKQDHIKKHHTPEKQSLLFYGGPFIPNGIATSFINLLSHIDYEKYEVTVAVDTRSVANFPDRMDKFNEVPSQVKLIGRFGTMNLTQEEKWIGDKLNFYKNFPTQEMKNIHKHSFNREYRRVFGNAKFDAAINFEGYNRLWSSLLSSINTLATPRNTKKLVYLHSDIFSEWKVKFPHQEINIRQYSDFDELISVSKANRDVNLNNLSEHFDLPTGKFSYCDNIQNPKLVITRSTEPLERQEHAAIFEGHGPVFVTIGRFSIEKRHDKLINAFSEFCYGHPSAKLLLIGSGPMRNDLIKQIKSLNLENNVVLTGQLKNPFPYLKQADCFVLSSDHEGQPMVLFEAMILNKAIIATDIKSCRGVIEGRSGLLVENSSNGLQGGMLAFANGNIKVNPFDYDRYQNDAINMFYEKLFH